MQFSVDTAILHKFSYFIGNWEKSEKIGLVLNSLYFVHKNQQKILMSFSQVEKLVNTSGLFWQIPVLNALLANWR